MIIIIKPVTCKTRTAISWDVGQYVLICRELGLVKVYHKVELLREKRIKCDRQAQYGHH